MKEIKKVLICGLGAVGSIFADKIKKNKEFELKILVDETRFKRYSNNPIIFNGEKLNLDYLLPDNGGYKADLIIIATKFSGLFEAREQINNFVKENTIIMSLLNGVTSEEILAQRYGCEKLLLSYFINHSSVRCSQNVTFDGVGKVVFGFSEKIGNKKNTQLVKYFFKKLNMDYEIPNDIEYSLWLKFMLNVSVNPLTAILKMKFGELLANEKAINFAVEMMKEVQNIAKVEGVKNSERMIDETIQNLNAMSIDGKTSMFQDVEAKRQTEIEMFCGTVINLGRKYGILTPKNQVLYDLIKIIQESY